MATLASASFSTQPWGSTEQQGLERRHLSRDYRKETGRCYSESGFGFEFEVGLEFEFGFELEFGFEFGLEFGFEFGLEFGFGLGLGVRAQEHDCLGNPLASSTGADHLCTHPHRVHQYYAFLARSPPVLHHVAMQA